MKNKNLSDKINDILAKISSQAKYSRASMLNVANQLFTELVTQLDNDIRVEQKKNKELKSLNTTLIQKLETTEKYYAQLIKDNNYALQVKDNKMRQSAKDLDSLKKEFEKYKTDNTLMGKVKQKLKFKK